ncbi:MAG: DUF4175 domain-containing protein, partial [Planctomycetia bacterium]|nr:DUF4175 domain-containing protein [Planctomycetia bacterium]
ARRAIREDIEGILAMQNQARTPVDEALRTLSKTDRVGKPALENLKNAEMTQRQVTSRVTNKADGLEQKISRFQDDLKNFKLPNSDAQKQMDGMRATVAKLREDNLEPAEQGLTHATKNLGEPQGDRPGEAEKPADAGKAQAPKGENPPPSQKNQAKAGDTPKGKQGPLKADSSKPEPDDARGAPSKKNQAPTGDDSRAGKAPANSPKDAAKEALAEAQTNQKAISEELKKMLDGLGEFETYRGVVKDAEKLLKEHEQVMKQTSEAAAKPELTGKTPEQLTPEQKADLSNLAARQGNVAKDTQNLQEKLNQMGQRLGESDPLAASAMKEAADQLQKKGTAAKVGETADQLDKNQMGTARRGQEQARQDLKDLVDSIQNRRERELSRLVKELKNAEAELEKLRQRQTQNLEKTRAAGKNPDAKQRENELKRLAKEQAEIQKQLENQLKRLAKLNAESAARAAARAAGKMGQAQANLEQGQGEQGEKDQDDALADLEEAQDRAREARKEAEEQLAMEQFSKMGDQLKGLAEREEKIRTDAAGYEALRARNQNKLTIAQRTGIRQLAGTQEAVKDETAELIEKLEGAPVFALTLKRASAGMETAAQRLQSLKTDEPT